MKFLFLLITPLIFLTHCGFLTTSRNDAVQSELGLNIPKWGIAVDAVYDPRLDGLVPGYKILNVVLSNRTQKSIYLDLKKDRWVLLDNIGNPNKAINHLRVLNPKLWNSLPEGLRDKLEYPQLVRVGTSARIDLFFPNTVELKNFRIINWKSAHFNENFQLINTIEKKLDVNPAKIGKQPPPLTPSQEQAQEKYGPNKEGENLETENPEEENTEEVNPIEEPKTIPSFDPELDKGTNPGN